MIRARFEKQLEELRTEILAMAGMVLEELDLALESMAHMDEELAHQVYALDKQVNRMRFETEEKCFSLIVTQQPAAGDLRGIIAVINMIVDLERMGDQAKGIAKIVLRTPEQSIVPEEFEQMGRLVRKMLHQSIDAYSSDSVELARSISDQDDEVDALYARLFTTTMERMAAAGAANTVEAHYEVLRAARELERFGDLATNIAERVIYRLTGELHEINQDG